jgi:hypothetical protein
VAREFVDWTCKQTNGGRAPGQPPLTSPAARLKLPFPQHALEYRMSDLPTTIDDFKKTPKLMAAYMAYAKRRLMLNEVMFYFDKGNAQGVYPKYLDLKSNTQVNVNSTVTDVTEKLAKAGDWANAAWPKVIAVAKAQVKATIDPDIQTGFAKSDEYKNYCKAEKMGDPAKAAKLLGITDVKKLTAAMQAGAVGDDKTAVKLLNEILVKEKMKAKAEELLKALEKAGLVG